MSGEVLAGAQDFGIDAQTVIHLASQLKAVVDAGVEVGIVIGGGNIFRGLSGATDGMERVTGDYLGMTATVMNSVALQNYMEKHSIYLVVKMRFGIGK